MLKVKFVGSVEGVSGSCTWLHHTDSDTQLLIDCGMNQGSKLDDWKNNQPFPFDPSQIKYVLLTHAHLDHCGLLPKLVKENFCGVVYATRATRDLTEIMLLDSAKVNGTPKDVTHIKAINWSIIDDDLGFKWGRVIKLADGLRFSLLRSSHVLGACCVSVSWMLKDADGVSDIRSEKNIFFSGDIGPQSDENPYLPLLKAGHNPFPNTNYIVTEATYGNRKRAREFQCTETRRKRLAETILHTVYTKKGKVILPAFSLHRTQELLADLYWLFSEGWGKLAPKELVGEIVNGKYEFPLRVCVDSPLGYKVTEAYHKHLFQRSPNGKYKYYKGSTSPNKNDDFKSFLDDLFGEYGSFFDRGNLIKFFRPDTNRKLHGGENGPNRIKHKTQNSPVKTDLKFDRYSVFVASAGMCGAGPVVEYLEQFDNDPANTIILTGYQSEGTEGRKLMNRATIECQPTEGVLLGKAEVVDMSGFYSAHGDQDMLLENIFNLNDIKSETPAKVFINHGEAASKEDLELAIRRRLELKAPGERKVRDVCVAESRWFDLNNDEYLPEVETDNSACTEELKTNMAEMKTEIKELWKKVEQLLERVEA